MTTTVTRERESTPKPGDAVYWLDADSPGLPITLDLRPLLGGKTLAEIDFDCIAAFLEANELYAIEYNETGELIIMPPIVDARRKFGVIAYRHRYHVAVGTWRYDAILNHHIPYPRSGRAWARIASWISPERLAALDAEQHRTGQICPDFVAEIRSPGNSLTYLQRKMAECIAAGARLGWLIDPLQPPGDYLPPRTRTRNAGRPGRYLPARNVMPGFEFRVRELIFDAVE